MISIGQVQTGAAWRDFIQLPWELYRGDPAWVPPLRLQQRQLFDLRKHPFWRANPAVFFLAKKEGRPVGRIAAFLNQGYDKKFGSGTGFFGFFECIDDPAVARLLFDEVKKFLGGHGCSELLGPVNPSLHYELGILIKGFEHPPYLMMTHSPVYYRTLLEKLGFSKARDFFAYRIATEVFRQTGRMQRVATYLKQRKGIAIRNGNLQQFTGELELIRSLYNDAFAQHWGFFPLEEDEFRALGEDMKQIIDPEFVLLAGQKEPLGFLLCLPNYNEVFQRIKNGKLLPFGWLKLLYHRKRIRTARILLIGVKRDSQHLGLGAILYPEIASRLIGKGYTHGELSWVEESNHTMIRAVEKMGAERYKEYRLYKTSL